MFYRFALFVIMIASFVISQDISNEDDNDRAREFIIYLDFDLVDDQRFILKKQVEDIVTSELVETIWLDRRPEFFVVSGTDEQIEKIRSIRGVSSLPTLWIVPLTPLRFAS